MWAFVLYDAKKENLSCSRDRFGIKPFYLLRTNERFIVGSEIKQLLPYLSERKANIYLVLDFLILGLEEHTSSTFFQGIEKLPPSTNLIYNLKTNEVNSYVYHTYIPTSNNLNEIQATSFVKDLFETSVRIRMRSDVKVGTCLSGGLDSSIVAALSAQLNFRDTDISFRKFWFYIRVLRFWGNWHHCIPYNICWVSSSYYSWKFSLIQIILECNSQETAT